MKTISSLISVIAIALTFSSCSKTELREIESKKLSANNLSTNNNIKEDPNARLQATTETDIYYKDASYTAKLQPASEEIAAMYLSNPQYLGAIYTFDLRLANDAFFLPVVTNVRGAADDDPYWQVLKISFNSEFRPHQFTSSDEVLKAASGRNPEIRIESSKTVLHGSVAIPTKSPLSK